jgi:hypothetical protein
MSQYSRLFPKAPRKKITFEPLTWKPSKFIRIFMKDCPHQDFQKRTIELLRIIPATHLNKKLREAGLSDFFLSIGTAQCTDKNIHDGDTVVFSFSQKGGLKCGEWEVTVRTQVRDPGSQLASKIQVWLNPTWQLPIADYHEFFHLEQMESLSTILSCPVLTGRYQVAETDDGNRRLLMIEYFRNDRNEFIFAKGEKNSPKFCKSLKLDPLLDNARRRKDSRTNADRLQALQIRFQEILKPHGHTMRGQEGQWGTLEDTQEAAFAWQRGTADEDLTMILREYWSTDIFNNLFQTCEIGHYSRIRDYFKLSDDEWHGHILAFQVNAELSITFFKGAQCLLYVTTQGQYTKLLQDIMNSLEHSRITFSQQSTLPTRKQIDTLVEQIKRTSFAQFVNQTILCAWQPITQIPARDLWQERGALIQQAEEELRINVSQNMANQGIDAIDWEDWDNTGHLQRLKEFHEMVDFFLPLKYIQTGHADHAVRAEWVNDTWDQTIPTIQVFYFETDSPMEIKTLRISRDSPRDNLIEIFGHWNEFHVGSQPISAVEIEEGMLIEVTARYSMQEFEITGRIFTQQQQEQLKELFRSTLSPYNRAFTLTQMKASPFERQLRQINPDSPLLVEIHSLRTQTNSHAIIIRWWTAHGTESLFIVRSPDQTKRKQMLADLTKLNVPQDLSGFSETTRESITKWLHQLYQVSPQVIIFGTNPHIAEVSLKDQASLFPSVGFEIAADLPNPFKVKQFLFRSWSLSPIELGILLREEQFLTQFQNLIEYQIRAWIGRIWLLAFDDQSKCCILHWMKSGAMQHMMIYDSQGKAQIMQRSFRR